VIANAGVADYYGPLSTAPTDEFQRHYSVNVLGPIALFQETLPLLKKSSQPKFVAVSTAIGSIAEIDNLPMLFAPYGASKAALNWTVRKIHAENPELIAFPISPG
jgi:norsolorinic acid ketoreductase